MPTEKPVPIRINEWPMRDVRELETRTGKRWSDVFRKDQPPTADEMIVVYWLARRQIEPDFTLELAEMEPFSEIQRMMVGVAAEATAAAGRPLDGTPSATGGSPRSRTSSATRRRNSGV